MPDYDSRSDGLYVGRRAGRRPTPDSRTTHACRPHVHRRLAARGAATGVVYGRNDDGTFFHGSPDAPVTLIDYSDFL